MSASGWLQLAIYLLVLLLFSNIVIGYTNFFRNRETNFLVSLPLPSRTIWVPPAETVYGDTRVSVFAVA